MRHAFVLVVAFFVCAIGAGTGAMFFIASEISHPSEPSEIVGTDLYGNELKLTEFRGKVVLLVFWATSDENNQMHQEFVTRLQEKFSGQKFTVVGVNGDASRAFAQSVATKNGYDFHSWHDGPHGPIARKWLVTDYPTFFLIDAAGQVHERYDTLLIPMEAEHDITRLLRLAKGK